MKEEKLVFCQEWQDIYQRKEDHVYCVFGLLDMAEMPNEYRPKFTQSIVLPPKELSNIEITVSLSRR